jgi:NAD(P)-dependent dehydrogenase (short-subunit alcohol dehydrogenase family)
MPDKKNATSTKKDKANSRAGAAARTIVPLVGIGLAAGSGLIFAALHKRRGKPLDGKVVFITGGSRGLGLALADEFLRAGCRVAIAARNAAELEKAEQKLRKHLPWTHKRSVFSVECDVTKPETLQTAIDSATRELGEIDILVNNAGIITVAPMSNQPLESYQQAMDTNFYGTLHTSNAVLPRMRARRSGTIVNITSIGGLVAVPHLLPYTASKFAAVGLSRGMHAELRPYGVNVLTVCPWLMRTGSHLHAIFGGKRSREYAWFTLGASLPFVSVSAKDAARSIVQATAQGRSELLISPLAYAAAIAAHNAPELTGAVLGAVSRLLPSPATERHQFVQGKDTAAPSSALLKTISKKDTAEWNQR